MRSSTFASLAAVLGASPALVLCSSTTSTSGSPTCVTLTETTGTGCPAITGLCPHPECVELQTITLECGCPSIFSTTICATGCPRGCGTTYETLYIPCATSVSSPPPVTTTSTSTSSIFSSSAKSSPSPTSSASTSPAYPKSTTTSASVNSITSCPVSGSCNSQKTTRTSTCPSGSTCSAVSTTTPQTITETTVTGKTGPAPTPSTVGSASPLQANEGSRYGFGVVEGGVLVGLIGAVLGMM